MFNAKEQKDKVVQWIRDWFDKNGKGCNAVIGISGGKDSTVAAGLCVEALGNNKVYGVMMPQGRQHDINDSIEVCNYLKIPNLTINIGDATQLILGLVDRELTGGTKLVHEDGSTSTDHEAYGAISVQAATNAPPRVRMTVLYAVAQSLNGRVTNTCNLSEDYVGYSTKYGDAAGDFAPLKSFTSEEVIEIGRELGLPEHLLIKPPADGLCGKTDEDNLGFTYAVLNKYIRTGKINDEETKIKIDRKHETNLFKERVIERYVYEPKD